MCPAMRGYVPSVRIARFMITKSFACSRILVAYSGSCGEAVGARRRPAGGPLAAKISNNVADYPFVAG